ncbi:MAG TPA: YihY/virulence factor BrkB family protein [Candidatus Sulfotelmatobacter sp.]|nr:YihY/virulence factor BrkB family protein [Candidatus Sulfotelmatobacter sp.]
MRLSQVKTALGRTYEDVQQKHTMQMAAGLSYYFVMALFPLLIVFAATVAYLPLPNLFDQALAFVGRFMPHESLGLVKAVLRQVITPHRGKLLSFGIVGAVWTASGGFSSMMEALNVAYDVPENRPFWKTRPLAIGLTFLIGILLVIALAVMLVGPNFGGWLAAKVGLGSVFVALWPYLRWTIAVAFAVLAVEFIYFLAPNVRQRFRKTLPGAAVAVGCWILLSWALGVYFQHFTNLNKTYGTLAAAIALMVWLYWTAFAILLGGEINADLLREEGKRLALKQAPEAQDRTDSALNKAA